MMTIRYALTGCFLVAALAAAPAVAAEPKKAVEPKARTIEISVTEDGFEPTPIKVKKGEPLKLVVTRKIEATCAKQLILDEAKINVELPLNKAVEVSFSPSKSGEVKYGCSMGKMIAGVLIVE
ncbi:MAG: cupredoxin domain-containing protein [Myxococcaceae bacterium]